MPCREASGRSEVIVIPTSVHLPSSDMPGIVHSVVLTGKLRLAQHGKDEADIWSMSFGTPDFTNLLKLSEEMESRFSRSQDPQRGLWPLGCSQLRVPGGEVSTNSRNASS